MSRPRVCSLSAGAVSCGGRASWHLTTIELTKAEWARFLPTIPYAPACR
jgi:hypothetical protein